MIRYYLIDKTNFEKDKKLCEGSHRRVRGYVDLNKVKKVFKDWNHNSVLMSYDGINWKEVF